MRIVSALVAITAPAFSAAFPGVVYNDDLAAAPCLQVPACPAVGTVSYTSSVPSTDTTPFPKTEVALCYDDSFIHITFTALNDTSFYCTSNLRG